MSKTILLADDSVTIRKVVELTFMDESFELISVASGSEALERFATGVDLVIADVHMPGADGYEVCERVKRESPGTPVLLLVGTFETYDEQRAADVGADGHLKKPFDSQDLLSRVHDLLAQSPDAGAEPQPVVMASPAPTPGEGTTEQGSPEPAARQEWQVEASGISATASDGFNSVEHAAPSGVESPNEEAEVAAIPAAHDAEEADSRISDEAVDRIARRVVELLSEEFIREVAWEVIPDLAEIVIKERLNELERQVE